MLSEVTTAPAFLTCLTISSYAASPMPQTFLSPVSIFAVSCPIVLIPRSCNLKYTLFDSPRTHISSLFMSFAFSIASLSISPSFRGFVVLLRSVSRYSGWFILSRYSSAPCHPRRYASSSVVLNFFIR